jgi:hypothetical protein
MENFCLGPNQFVWYFLYLCEVMVYKSMGKKGSLL